MLLLVGRKASRARLALASLATAHRLTRVLCLLAVAAVGAAGVAVIVAGQFANRAEVGVAICIVLMTTALAVLVSRRRPTNLVGPLLAWMALQAGLDAFSTTYLPTRARRPDVLPDLPDIASAALATTWVWLYAAVALLMLFFPDGRLPGRRWRWVALGLPAVALMVQVVMAVSPGPYDPPYAAVRHPFGDLPEDLVLGLKVVLFPLLVGLMLACALCLRFRFRRADEKGRKQLKWLALAALAVPGTVMLSWIGFLLLGTHELAGVGIAVLYTAVPAATAIAILRHNLYDVDRALSTGVTYTAVTAALLAVFTTVSFAGGVLLGRDSAAAAAGATALTAVAIAPTRRRLQRVVDRRLYPLRQAALDAIERLGRSVAVGEARPEQLEEVLRLALRDPALRVGILVPGGHGLCDPAGEPLSLDGTATPVSVHGQQIGAIASGGAAPAQLLREIATASAMLVEMVRLRLELSAALREVESSRTRLQRIGDKERRRLERDLHDGAQQRLVSLGMALRLAQRQLGNGAVDLDGLLDEAVAQLGTAVAELRAVAHGLRPSHLDNGLQPALSALAESATVPIDLEVEADRTIPDDVATTAYYVVSESVTNVVKHAEASRVLLRVIQDDGKLSVRIEDDGRGGAAMRTGSGLAGLSDRVAAAGGSLSVHSTPSEGTTVEATLPCAS